MKDKCDCCQVYEFKTRPLGDEAGNSCSPVTSHELIQLSIQASTEFLQQQVKEMTDPIHISIGFSRPDGKSIYLCDRCKALTLAESLNQRFGVRFFIPLKEKKCHT